jgi:hypothetical protein
MALQELINQARTRQRRRDEAEEKAMQEKELSDLRTRVEHTFGAEFVANLGGQYEHDGQPYVGVTHQGQPYKLKLSRNADGSRTWIVNGYTLFKSGREPEQQECIDTVALAIAELAESKPESEQAAPATQRLQAEEPETQPE